MILTNDYIVPGQLLEFRDPFLFTDMHSHVGELCWYLRQSGVTCFSVRGKSARTVVDMFDEFIPALQFPSFCAKNWGAFDECLCDLASWIFLGNAIVIVMADADQAMIDDPDGAQLGYFVGAISEAAATYGVPDLTGPLCTQRAAIPFHIVLDFQDENGPERWKQAGAPLVPLDTAGLRQIISETEAESRRAMEDELAMLRLTQNDRQPWVPR